jgi:putative aldouronate transport system substrate-binding protein
MKKRSIACLLLAAMLLTLLAACGGTATETETAQAEETTEAVEASEAPAASPEASEAPAESASPAEEAPAEEAPEAPAEEAPALQSVELPLFEETRTYTMWTMLPFFMNGFVSDMSTDIHIIDLLQQYCNVDLQIDYVSDQVVSEQFGLLVASDNYPDIFSNGLSYYTRGYDAAITDDVVIDLLELAEEYAPNFLYYLETDDELRKTMITDNGALASIPVIYQEAGCENQGILIRSDWLEELGMDEPKTYDQLHDYIQACIAAYGGQGITIGNSLATVMADSVQFAYGFDLNPGDFNVIDGQVVYSYLNDNYYDYLQLLADWYADGTIYSDFYSAGMGDTDQWFAAGLCCLDTGSAANIATIDAYADPANPYEMMPIDPPKVNEDDQLHFSWTDANSRIKAQDAWAISTQCDDPVGIMQMVNYLFSEEGQLMFNYGDEGYTFEYDENGKPQYTELITNNPDGISYKDACFLYVSAVASSFIPSVMDATAGYYYFSDDEWAIFDRFRVCDADGSYNLPNGVALNESENEEYASLSNDVTTYAATAIMQFVTGATPLNEETFAAFQDQVVAMGGHRMEELYQSAYERYLEK